MKMTQNHMLGPKTVCLHEGQILTDVELRANHVCNTLLLV